MRWGFHFCVSILFLAIGGVVLANEAAPIAAPASAATPPAAAAPGAAVPTTAPANTGSLEITFSQRSPLSEMKSLTKRLKFDEPATDYVLSKEPFVAYVPEKYDPRKPMGLLVLMLYKPTVELPRPLFAELADVNMAFIVCQHLPAQWWQRAGLALDAAYNMQLLFNIDRRRIYLFGSWDKNDAGMRVDSTERLAFNYPEVFSGLFILDSGSFARITLVANRSFLEPSFPPPPDQSLSLAKARPLVLATHEKGLAKDQIAAWFSQTGFRHMKYLIVTSDDYHYPQNKTGWLPEILKFMDAATAELKLPPALPRPAIAKYPAPLVQVIGLPRPAVAPAVAPPPPAIVLPAGLKTGEYQLTLTQRSPNSTPVELARRLGLKPEEVQGDYDLAKMPLAVYVPAYYDPASPPGLLVYRHAGRFPEVAASLKSLMDEMHLIFVSPVDDTLPAWQDAGLMLNIAADFEAHYSVNKSRIYLMEDDDSHFIAFGVSDVYTGFISLWKFAYPGVVKGGTGRKVLSFNPHDPHVPAPDIMAAAKTRGFLFAVNPRMNPAVEEEVLRPATVTWMQRVGFPETLSLAADPGQIIYPHIHHDFLRPAIYFLDTRHHSETTAPPAPAVATPSTPAPATPSPAAPTTPAPAAVPLEEPTHAQATRLLKLGKLYIDARQFSQARSKLNELIKKYPQDADAATARQLLDQLPPP